MAIIFPIVAFLLALAGVRRSAGLGLAAVIGVGYFNGGVRANFLGVFTTFMFDFALLGLYAGFLAYRPADARAAVRSPAGRWVGVLVAWPAILCFMPANDYLVQLVALRATVWFLPVMLVATRIGPADLLTLSRALGGLNLVALAVGVYVYTFGVEALYPENAVTETMYKSQDVAGHKFHRVPSTFLNAHSYGGTMLFTLPLLLNQLFGPRVRPADRWLAAGGVVAALAGVLLCAARLPAVVLVVTAVVAWAASRFHTGIGIGGAVVLVGAGLAAGTNDRLQRALTVVEDTEMVSERVRVSANETFFDLMLEYPVGAGMGSSVGTSIPFFLADRAPQAIGLENEYCRILVDQGLPGLLLWVGFLVWLFGRPPPARTGAAWGLGVVFMYALCLTNWATAFIGAGVLSGIPGSALLLTQMGVVAAVRGER